MRKTKLMNGLKELLEDLSTEEREAAIAYYDNFFENAGIENTDDILPELAHMKERQHL